jgi:hypothetical protein
MNIRIAVCKWFNKTVPPNYLIRHPFVGALIVGLFGFAFTLLYKPVGVHAGRFFSYELTMAIYSLVLAASVFGVIKILKATKFFSNADEWTILKEISAIVIILLGTGTVVYFLAFAMEVKADRWNWQTLFDSWLRTFLIGIIPFLFFSAMNFRYWLAGEQMEYLASTTPQARPPENAVKPITIKSQLKKEELSFFPDQFIYAVSEGNYVTFYLDRDAAIEKEIIRNSISNIEEQLKKVDRFMRTHRAFIVNLKKIETARGNSLGYRLKLSGSSHEIPVSRSNARKFIRRFEEFKN